MIRSLFAFALVLFSTTVACSKDYPVAGEVEITTSRVIFGGRVEVQDMNQPALACMTNLVTIGGTGDIQVSIYSVTAAEITPALVIANGQFIANMSASTTRVAAFAGRYSHWVALVTSIGTDNNRETTVDVDCYNQSEAGQRGAMPEVTEGTTDSNDGYGDWVLCTGACTRTLAAVGFSGQNACYYALTSAVITLELQDADAFRTPAGLQTAGKNLTSAGNHADQICVLSRENGANDEWIVTSSTGMWTIEP